MEILPATAFIIRDGDLFLCPVCGWAGTFDGNHFHDEEGGCIATGICDCCHYEPGFDDNPLASEHAKPTIDESIIAYRAAWLAKGAPWVGGAAKPRPHGWSATAQLDRLYELAPFLEPTTVISSGNTGLWLEVRRLARAFLADQLSPIEAAVALSPYRHHEHPREADEAFLDLLAVDSETDAIPTGERRLLWHPDARAAEDVKHDRSQAWARPLVEKACRKLLEISGCPSE